MTEHTPGPCIFCGEWVEDESEDVGAPDWAQPAWAIDGDHGCGSNPITGPEGTGGHIRPNDPWLTCAQLQYEGPTSMEELRAILAEIDGVTP